MVKNSFSPVGNGNMFIFQGDLSKWRRPSGVPGSNPAERLAGGWEEPFGGWEEPFGR